jgi:bifunctional non-homologous end joining protein LigD
MLPRITPIAPTRIRAPFDHPDWIFELKHDGFRAVAYILAGKCELVSRRRNVYKSFGPLRDALAQIRLTDVAADRGRKIPALIFDARMPGHER